MGLWAGVAGRADPEMPPSASCSWKVRRQKYCLTFSLVPFSTIRSFNALFLCHAERIESSNLMRAHNRDVPLVLCVWCMLESGVQQRWASSGLLVAGVPTGIRPLKKVRHHSDSTSSCIRQCEHWSANPFLAHPPHAGLLRSLRSLVKLLLDVAPIGPSTLIESSR